ncbi:37933_t:CDS:2 [Gigaspora margarita]|uniref:37933_t:CDS:1 n=1 Tax=Gigaspora margarita TaxID=4874 RepID=A0ABN7VRH9_GIGMA|nr:37933_t:CDS:2 [Gigaspora margarita]
MFQQTTANIIVPDLPDLHIIEQIRDSNIENAKTLDLGCDDKLINIINQFINQKRSIIKNNSESISLDQPDQIIIMDPLVTKHREWATTKRLKSSSECQSYKASTHSYYTINSQDSNLRIPLASLLNNDSNDSHALNNNIKKPCNESKRRYLCNVCGGIGHNARMYKQQK